MWVREIERAGGQHPQVIQSGVSRREKGHNQSTLQLKRISIVQADVKREECWSGKVEEKETHGQLYELTQAVVV